MFSFWDVSVMLLKFLILIGLFIGEIHLLLYLIDIGHILSYIAVGIISFFTLALLLWIFQRTI